MCRFTLYMGPSITLGSLITDPTHSLINQSFASRERSEPLNGDGFGVAWWSASRPESPAVFRSITPAWSNRNLQELGAVVHSTAIMAHVRAATRGSGTIEVNCHPFKAQGYAFMHNGDVGSFPKLKRPLLNTLSDASFSAILGSTDSEHIFALFLDAASEVGCVRGDVVKMSEALELATRRLITLAQEHEPSAELWLNFAVSDGLTAVVLRYTNLPDHDGSSLYLNTGRRYICEDGMCRMIAPTKDEGAVIVSSEPLSEDPGWHPVPARSMVLIHADRTTSTKKLEF